METQKKRMGTQITWIGQICTEKNPFFIRYTCVIHVSIKNFGAVGFIPLIGICPGCYRLRYRSGPALRCGPSLSFGLSHPAAHGHLVKGSSLKIEHLKLNIEHSFKQKKIDQYTIDQFSMFNAQ